MKLDGYTDEFYPLAIQRNFINDDFYQKLKDSFPDFSKVKTTGSGMAHRKNIPIVKGNQYYKQFAASNPFIKLFNDFDSAEFKSSLAGIFTPDILSQYGFKGEFATMETEMHISEATTGYCNPWHVDTRGRIIHALLYFGADDIESGGEIAIAKHKKLNSWKDYPQFPVINDLADTKTFEIEDNLAIFVLSTPNSYHRGMPLVGKRRFVYLAYNEAKKKPAWECGWVNNRRPFAHGLKLQKN